MATGLKFAAAFLVIFVPNALKGEISDQRLCGDPKCEEPVSYGTTIIGYNGDDKHSLSFLKGVKITIYSKSAGSVQHLWGGMVNGKRGYFPREFVREDKILKSSLTHIVPTEKVGDFNKSREKRDTQTSSTSRNGSESESTMEETTEKQRNDEHSSTESKPESAASQHTNADGSIKKPSSTTKDLNRLPIQYESTDRGGSKMPSEGSPNEFGSAALTKQQQTDNKLNVQSDSSSATSYSYMPASAFKPSMTLDNIVAHTKEVHLGEHDGDSLPNSAEWFPEGSVAGDAVTKESSTFVQNVGKATDSLSYAIVDGTQIVMNDDENPVRYGTPTPPSIFNSNRSLQPSSSVNSVSNSRLYDDNVATSTSAPFANEMPDIATSASPNLAPTGTASSLGPPAKHDVSNEVARSKVTEIGSGGEDSTPESKVEHLDSSEPSVAKLQELENKEPIVSGENTDQTDSGGSGFLNDIIDIFSLSADGDGAKVVEENRIVEKSDVDAGPSNEPSSVTMPRQEAAQVGAPESGPSMGTDESPLLTGGENREEQEQEGGARDQREQTKEGGVNDDRADDEDGVGDDADVKDDDNEDEDENGEDDNDDYHQEAVSEGVASPDTLNERSYHDGDRNRNSASDRATQRSAENVTVQEATENSTMTADVATENENSAAADLQDLPLNDSAAIENPESNVRNKISNEENTQEDHNGSVDSMSGDINDTVGDGRSNSGDVAMEGLTNEESMASVFDSEQMKTETSGTKNSNVGTADASLEGNVETRSSPDASAFNFAQHASDPTSDAGNVPGEDVRSSDSVVDFDSYSTTEYSASDSDEHLSSIESVPESHSMTPQLPSDSSHTAFESGDTCKGPGFEGSCSELDTGSEKPSFSGEWFAATEQNSAEETSISTLEAIRIKLQYVIDLLPESIRVVMYDLQAVAVSPRVVVLVIIVGFFIVLLEIIYFLIKKRFKEASLLARISSLDRELFTCAKERDILKDKIETFTNENWEGAYLQAQSTIQALEDELKASQSHSGKLQEAFTKLQEQLNAQQVTVTNLQLTTEATQQEKLTLIEELENLRVSYAAMEQSSNQLIHNLDEIQKVKETLVQEGASKDEKIAQMQQSSEVLLKEAEVWNESVKQLQSTIEEDKRHIQELKTAIALKENELEVLKDCVLDLKTSSEKLGSKTDAEDVLTSENGDILKKLMDASSIKAALKLATDERDLLLNQLKGEKASRALAEEVANRSKMESERLRADYEIAIREKDDAQTKLQVLSNYFKEKELQLQKELGVHEAMRQQSQESVFSVTQKIAVYEQETELHKSQINSLKMEIENQERSYKNQLTAHEKKAHENWLAARAAERKLEEAKQEAAVLRNRLTLLEQSKSNQAANQTDAPKINQTYTDSNGEVPSPPRLGPGDRSDSMDLPTSSRSSLFREPLDFPSQGLPFLPADRPLPPPFLHGMPPRPLVPLPLLPPPLDDRLPLPPGHPYDPRRGSFPMPPPPPPPGVMSTPPPPEHWMAPGRRGSPPPFDRLSHRDRPSPPSSQHPLSPPPYDRLPPSSARRAMSPPNSNPHEMGRFDRDHRERTPPARFCDPPMGLPPFGHPPPPMRGHPGIRPPFRRDAYPAGGADGSIDPRTSSPLNVQRDNNGKSAV